jgi:hypothetical protein
MLTVTARAPLCSLHSHDHNASSTSTRWCRGGKKYATVAAHASVAEATELCGIRRIVSQRGAHTQEAWSHLYLGVGWLWYLLELHVLCDLLQIQQMRAEHVQEVRKANPLVIHTARATVTERF